MLCPMLRWIIIISLVSAGDYGPKSGTVSGPPAVIRKESVLRKDCEHQLNQAQSTISRNLSWEDTDGVHDLESSTGSHPDTPFIPQNNAQNESAKLSLYKPEDVSIVWDIMSDAVAATIKQSDSSQVRLALVGTGRMASIHFKNIAKDPSAVIVAVIDDNTVERAQQFVDQHAMHSPQSTKLLVSSDLEFALKSTVVDGVVVCSASNRHYKHIKIALQHKKAVFVEKPLANSISEIDELYGMALSQNVPPIMVGYQRRFDRNIKSIYTQIHEEDALCPRSRVDGLTPTIGGIEKIISISKDPTYPEVEYIGGSINGFYDSIIHDIDTICFITKQFPNRVYTAAHAHYQPIAKLGDFDRVFITMHFPSGLLAMIDWCRHSGCSYVQRLSVQGYNGIIEMENVRENEVVRHSHFGEIRSKPLDYFLERYADGYRNEMKEFVKVIQGKSNVSTTHEQVRNVNIVVAAAEKSARSGKPVDIRY